jgi:hypothetical protein
MGAQILHTILGGGGLTPSRPPGVRTGGPAPRPGSPTRCRPHGAQFGGASAEALPSRTTPSYGPKAPAPTRRRCLPAPRAERPPRAGRPAGGAPCPGGRLTEPDTYSAEPPQSPRNRRPHPAQSPDQHRTGRRNLRRAGGPGRRRRRDEVPTPSVTRRLSPIWVGSAEPPRPPGNRRPHPAPIARATPNRAPKPGRPLQPCSPSATPRSTSTSLARRRAVGRRPAGQPGRRRSARPAQRRVPRWGDGATPDEALYFV